MPESLRVHPQALVESDKVGSGTRVWAFAHVCAGAVVGSDCNLCDHTYIESGGVLGDRVTLKNQVAVWDGVHIGDDVFIGPNVTFTNVKRPRIGFKKDSTEFLPTEIGKGATLGAGATILCGLAIGRYAFIAAGSVVTRDVDDFQLVMGNPARFYAWVCECGQSLPFNLECECGRHYHLLPGNRLCPAHEADSPA